MTKLTEYKATFPRNPVDGMTFKDSDGMEWLFLKEINDWALNLQNDETYQRYTSLDNLPHGNSDSPVAVSGHKNVFGWLDENM